MAGLVGIVFLLSSSLVSWHLLATELCFSSLSFIYMCTVFRVSLQKMTVYAFLFTGWVYTCFSYPSFLSSYPKS